MERLIGTSSATNTGISLKVDSTVPGALKTVESGVTQHRAFIGITSSVHNAVTANGDVRLLGYSAQESSGSGGTAAFNIKEGASATATSTTIIALTQFEAKQSDQQWYGPRGIDSTPGLSIDVTEGTLDVILYFDK